MNLAWRDLEVDPAAGRERPEQFGDIAHFKQRDHSTRVILRHAVPQFCL
jgi:hypothetical protein